MADIGSKQNGRFLCQEGRLRWRNERVHASELDVHLQAHIRTVLLLGHAGMRHLNTLRWDSNDGITDALDLSIQWDTRVGQNADQELRLRLDSVSGFQPGGLKTAFDVGVRISIKNGRLLIGDVLFTRIVYEMVRTSLRPKFSTIVHFSFPTVDAKRLLPFQCRCMSRSTLG